MRPSVLLLSCGRRTLVATMDHPGNRRRQSNVSPIRCPDKPSIAVLPFINVSSDTEQDHLAEGLTDDLITELSKVSGLFVIARHSVFALRTRSATSRTWPPNSASTSSWKARLQRAEQRLRINVKLIDALTGLSMWAERYDRQYADIFAVQDEVIGKIISALAVELNEGERDRF